MIENKEVFFAALESVGEKTVRENLAQRVYGSDKISLINEWLRQQQERRINEATSAAREAASRAEAATSKQLELTEEQLRLTRSANRAAWIAAIAAIIAIIVTIIIAK